MGLVVVRIQPLQFFVKRKYPSVDSTGVLAAVIPLLDKGSGTIFNIVATFMQPAFAEQYW